MDKMATENLFLLEFLVDTVKIDPKCECGDPPGEVCVSFSFLDNEPLEICEKDFVPQRKYGEEEFIKSGKSCLFSLSPEKAEICMDQFFIDIFLSKKTPAGWLPDRLQFGTASLSISNLFMELINSLQISEGGSPTAKTLKDEFDIYDSQCTEDEEESGRIIGKIGVYIRMSCFGKLIVTQFQMNLQDKSVLFKDKEGKSLYRYKKAGKGKKQSCAPRQPPGMDMGMGMGMGMGPQQGFGMNFGQAPSLGCPTIPCPEISGTMSDMGGMRNPGCPSSPCGVDQNGGVGQQVAFDVPCNQCGGMQNAACLPNQGMSGTRMGMGMGMGGMGMGGMGMGGMGMGGMGMSTGMTPCVECGNIPFAPCLPGGFGSPGGPGDAGNFVGANVPCQECADDPQAPCALSTRPPEPEGNYQEIGASLGGNSLTIRVHKDKSKVEQVDADGVAEDDNDCTCTPGQPGKKKNEQSFAMRPGVGKDGPFAFKMGEYGQGAPRGSVVVNPPVSTGPDGTQITEFSDPNKERFVLRIGKKSEGIDKKQNLELELCTPRGPELKPIPQKATRETQYDPKDAGPEGKKDGKKGDKKGGKKGKKK